MRLVNKNKNTVSLLFARLVLLIALAFCATAASASYISAGPVTTSWRCNNGECSVVGRVEIFWSCTGHYCSSAVPSGVHIVSGNFPNNTAGSGSAVVDAGTGRYTFSLIAYDANWRATEYSTSVVIENGSPKISNITNKSINEDTSKTVSFTISDPERPAGQLTLSKSSSNTTLLPNSRITFGGSGGNRTVTLKPATNKSGTTTVTISVSDGEKTSRDSFILTVNAVNDAPTISNISNQTINEDGSKTISFNVSDVETANGSLTLSATSSNTTLLPINRITFGGSGGSRTVTLKPAANKSGSASVTITVSDGNKSASDSFLLTVNPVNDVPIIGAIPDKTTNMNTTMELIVSISDVETSLGSLQVSASSSNTTLLPNNQIQLASHSGGKRIILTPVSYKSGSATVTLTVNDGTASVNKSFTLTVKEPGGLVNYRYDELGRLIKVIGTDDKSTEYDYDKSDNRVSKKVNN